MDQLTSLRGFFSSSSFSAIRVDHLLLLLLAINVKMAADEISI